MKYRECIDCGAQRKRTDSPRCAPCATKVREQREQEIITFECPGCGRQSRKKRYLTYARYLRKLRHHGLCWTCISEKARSKGRNLYVMFKCKECGKLEKMRRTAARLRKLGCCSRECLYKQMKKRGLRMGSPRNRIDVECPECKEVRSLPPCTVKQLKSNICRPCKLEMARIAPRKHRRLAVTCPICSQVRVMLLSRAKETASFSFERREVCCHTCGSLWRECVKKAPGASREFVVAAARALRSVRIAQVEIQDKAVEVGNAKQERQVDGAAGNY